MADEPANPMIAEALEEDKDATGLCTVRSLAGYMIEDEEKRQAKIAEAEGGFEPEGLYELPLNCELAFELPDGKRVNVEVAVTAIRQESSPA